MREREGLNVTLEQNRRRERGLEEEVKNLAEDLAEALRHLKELEGEEGGRRRELLLIMGCLPFMKRDDRQCCCLLKVKKFELTKE